MDAIQKQISRLEKVIDEVYEISKTELTHSHKITKQMLRALLYLQGLKVDYNVQKRKDSEIVKVEEGC